ncbi:hypothetical protein PL373_13575 [Tenacibaculum maritimum]|nr:hypothetical protein [Tenacibaculum maritimum]MDB0602159.1 hypothetical protein [Tenacibaculum maritimum]MDB0613835.1 hypothetical protein [Tenacibaculum maritimum]
MKLSESQIKKILENPKLKKEINEGKKYESRLRVFTEPKYLDDLKNEAGWKEVTSFLDNIFSTERSKRIKQYISYPLSSVDITESILTDLYKVFDARNTFFDFELTKSNGGDKLKTSIARINPVKWIEEKGKEVLKNKPNTVVVIDKDKDGNPYLLSIENDRIIDCSINTDSTLNYIAFTHSIEILDDGKTIKRVAFYDEQAYRVFIVDDGEYKEEINIPHNAGVCPARMFISDKFNSKDEFNRKIPFTSTLSKIKEWQLFDVYNFYVKHYGAFPIIERVEDICDVEGCHSGVIEESHTYYEGDVEKYGTKYIDCPACSKKELLGPGVVIDIPAKQTKDDPDSAGVFRMISPDTTSLEFTKTDLNDLEKNIKLKTVGIDSILNKEAINEMQVKGSFESRENVLLKIKSNFDELYKWIVQTVAKLQSGAKTDVKVHANFGTEFYLLSELELQEKYENAKKIGLPIEEVDMIYEQLIATKYKGNPSKITKLELIKLLDPLPHESVPEALEKMNLGLITEQEFFLKGRLISFLNRFEIENTPLVEFGKDLELHKRLQKIKEILNKYSDEYIKTKQTGDSSKATEGSTE